MCIRTMDEFENLISRNQDGSAKFYRYLPVELAYALPTILTVAGFDCSSKKSLESIISFLNPILKENPSFACRGFTREKTLNDGTVFKTDMHQCELCFEENIRTFGEANEFKSGCDSVGVHFTDPDDGYNDWVWVSVNVIIEKALSLETGMQPSNMNFPTDAVQLFCSAIKSIRADMDKKPPEPTPVCDDEVPPPESSRGELCECDVVVHGNSNS